MGSPGVLLSSIPPWLDTSLVVDTDKLCDMGSWAHNPQNSKCKSHTWFSIAHQKGCIFNARSEKVTLLICATADANLTLLLCATADAHVALLICATADANLTLLICATADANVTLLICAAADAHVTLLICATADANLTLLICATADANVAVLICASADMLETLVFQRHKPSPNDCFSFFGALKQIEGLSLLSL